MPPESAQPRAVLVLSDGRPGHFNQAKGIVRALELIGPVDLEWAEVRLRFGFLRRPLKWLLNSFFRPLPLWLLRGFYRLPRLRHKRPDVIVSAGGKTSFLNAALARRHNARNIFAGSLRGLSAELFSAVLTLEPIAGANSNLVVELAPTVIDPAEVRAAGEGYCRDKGLGDAPLWAMLIGGEGAGYGYTADDWRRLAKGMVALAETYRIKWLLTTSRRTGKEAEKILEGSLPEGILADAVWYGRDPRKVMTAFLGAAEVVFCTEDSLSMLTEAIAAGRPVISLAPKHSASDRRYTEALERLAGRKLLHRVALEQLGQAAIPQLSGELTPLRNSVATRLALQLEPVLNKGCEIV